jgi:hypothetical protein
MVLGMGVWLFALYLDTEINPLLYGLAGSIAGILPGFVGKPFISAEAPALPPSRRGKE